MPGLPTMYGKDPISASASVMMMTMATSLKNALLARHFARGHVH